MNPHLCPCEYGAPANPFLSFFPGVKGRLPNPDCQAISSWTMCLPAIPHPAIAMANPWQHTSRAGGEITQFISVNIRSPYRGFRYRERMTLGYYFTTPILLGDTNHWPPAFATTCRESCSQHPVIIPPIPRRYYVLYTPPPPFPILAKV